MDPVSLTASLIAVLQISGAVISALYEYRNGVKDAGKDAARIIGELNSLRSVLERLLQAVEREEMSANSSRLSTFQELLRPHGELEQCMADLESIRKKLGADRDDSPWKSVKRSLVWPLKEKEIEKLLRNVQQAKSTLHFALSVDQTVMTVEIHEGVQTLARAAASSAVHQRRADIQAWLDAPDPYPNHAAARKKYQHPTGDWFLKGKQYNNWRSSPNSFLWLNGIPGAGKSVLCSSIIEDLINDCKYNDSCVTVYYYFDFNDIGKRDVESLVRAIATQLLVKIPSISGHIEALSSRIIDKQPELDFVSQAFQAFVHEFEEVNIVIDALDECSNCEELMEWLEKVHGWQFDHIHILATSRQLPEIEEVIVDCATAVVRLQDSNLNQDIRILIQQRLKNDRKFQKWPAIVREEIEDALTTKASGMFRWVVCQLDMLRTCVALPALRKALSSLPKTLDETYERILVNIDESYVSDVQKILKYLAFAIRPVSLSEVVEVLAIDWDGAEPRFDQQHRMPDPQDILTMCSTLLTTSENLETTYLGNSYQDFRLTIRLAHFSVKEYLLSNRLKTSEASIYSLNPTAANLFIAKTYLIYLLSLDLSSEQNLSVYELERRYRTWPMLRSATLSWPIHVAMLGQDLDDETKSFIRKLFATRHDTNGGSYAAWVEGLIPGADQETIINTQPLYYAASYGMASVVQVLLSEIPTSDIDLKGGRAMSTPLHVACFRGKVEVVKLLLEAGADPNSTNCMGQSCLYWTRWGGLESREIYDLLTKYGARDRRVEQEESLIGKRSAEDVLADEHYTQEYYRLLANDLKAAGSDGD